MRSAVDAETDTIAEKLHTLEGDLPWMYAEAQGLARHALTRQPHKPAKGRMTVDQQVRS